MGNYPPGSSTDTKTELQAAVDAIARSSRGIKPDGTKIEIIETTRTTGDHDRFVATSDKGISITILGHANAVEASKGLQVGENNTQYNVKLEIAVDDMYFIDSYMQLLIRLIQQRNYGDNRYPVFSLDKSEPLNRKEHADLVDMFWRHGGTVSPDEYRKLGLDVDENQEPIIKPQGLGLLD
jgi:phage gp29-like protein